MSKVHVYYNSACPVCNRGITHQQKNMGDCKIIWNDIHTNLFAREELTGDLEFIRERLHVIDESGKTQIGIDAFSAIWRTSPDEQWKAHLVDLPIIKPIAAAVYNTFAKLLYRYNRWSGHW